MLEALLNIAPGRLKVSRGECVKRRRAEAATLVSSNEDLPFRSMMGDRGQRVPARMAMGPQDVVEG